MFNTENRASIANSIKEVAKLTSDIVVGGTVLIVSGFAFARQVKKAQEPIPPYKTYLEPSTIDRLISVDTI